MRMRFGHYAYITVICLLGIKATAQKLPNIQVMGLRAPANINIDGKAKEWGDMQAYNKATQIYYTIANDDVNLYLIVKAPSVDMVEKIVKGGITLTINTTAKKKVKDAPALTFPLYDKDAAKFYLVMDSKPALTGNAARDKMSADSFAVVKNRQLSANLKWISLANIKGISDSMLSVYNDEGIKVAYRIDNTLAYNYELAVPLKYLSLDINTSVKFYYNMQLNGAAFYAVKIEEPRPGLFVYIDRDGKAYSEGTSPTSASKIFPTDFWGEYKLIK